MQNGLMTALSDAQLSPASRRRARTELIRSAYTVLDLQSDFTAGVKEAHAWTGHMGDQDTRRRQRPAGAGSAVSRSAVDLFQHNRRI